MNAYKFSKRCFIRRYSSRYSEQEPLPVRLISEESFMAFQNSWPEILHRSLSRNTIPPEIKERLKKLTDHSLKDSNKFRPTLTLLAFDVLEKEKSTEVTQNEIITLAWGPEIVHSYLRIVDDFKNGTNISKGKSTWHTLPEVGTQIANDVILLRSLLFLILKDNFGGKSSYVDLRHLFDKAFFYTEIGLHLDMANTPTNNKYPNFTLDRYYKLIDYKTTYNTFKFPILLAMMLADKSDEKSHSCTANLCKDIGTLFQMQNDYKDCFGEDYGTSIPNGKYSWFAIQALQRCTPAQRIVFTSCYGSPEPAHIERIQQLYVKLQLPQLYLEERDKIAEEIRKKAHCLCTGTGFKPELFLKVLDAVKNYRFH